MDLDETKIVEYHDRVRVPPPKAEGTEYRLFKQKPPFGSQLNDFTTVKPGQAGF